MRRNRISKPFFFWAYALSVGSAVIADILAFATVMTGFKQDWLPAQLSHVLLLLHPHLAVLYWVLAIGYLLGLVVFVVFVYKAWKAIQDGQARTSAGKAAGFLLIPFFNIYWLFQAIWGFAKDYNRFLGRNELAGSKLPEKLYLAFSILISARWLYKTVATLKPITGVGYLLGPYYSYFLTILTCILAVIVIYKTCNAVNVLPGPTAER